jgi:hypothetical protein
LRSLKRVASGWNVGLALLMAGVLAVYLVTLAPGLTWANQGADGGDLISAAAVLGIAHPTGYPTYLLLARLFQCLPIGSLAYRTNLLSALCAALTAGLTAVLTRRYSGQAKPFAEPAGLLAGLAFGLSPLFWSQAVITEVYTLQALCVALVLWSLSGDGGGARDVRTGALVGLALGNHLTSLFLLPVCLAVMGRREGRWQFGALARLAGGLAVGLLVYLYVPLRALAMPPINWGNPSSWEGFWWLVSAQPYQGLAFKAPLPDVWTRVQAWAGLIVAQFGWPGMLVGFYGLFFGRGASAAAKGITSWLVAGFSIFAIGYAAPDSSMYLLPAFLAFAIWIGLGLAAALEGLATRPYWPAALAGVFLLLVLVNAGWHWREVDASRDNRAEAFGQAVMRAAPPAALVFVREDRDTFAVWYFHFALRERPDISVLVEPMLGFEWYRDSLQATYPDLTLPAQLSSSWREALVAVNPRPVCETRLDVPTALECNH